MTVTAQGPGLTDEQRAAVEWADGPLMVLAGAGTGKTTVVVERVRHLLGHDPTLRPENILVLTYNVRAAAELVRRLERALGLERASRLWVHNFHSFGHRLLTAHRAELGLADTGHMLDPIGQRLVLRDLRPRMGHFLYHDLSLNPEPVLGRFAELISRAKDELLTPSEFAAYVEGQRNAFVIQFGKDAWGEAVESIRQRLAENTLAPIWEVRSGLRDSPQEGAKSADRAARRTAAGINYAVGWNALTPAQRDLAVGLEATYLRDAAAFEVLRLQEEAEVYDLYQRTLHESGLVDFGEQQLRTIELLRDRPNLLLRYQTQFRHVLVDEFQDANMAQIALLELVGRGPDKPDNVVVVGDDDQSIYRFRGASYAAFSQFETRFARPPAWAPERPARPVVSLPLLQNRRSTEAILAAANRLIAHNAVRLKSGQALQGMREEGTPVEVAFARDEADEADLIVERLQSAFEEVPARLPNADGSDRPKRWSDLVVLYRRHRHREAIVERLRRSGIPYSLVGATGIFLQPEIRDLEAALRVCASPADNVAFTRLLTAGPWRFDAGEIVALTRAAAWDRRPVFDSATEINRAASLEVDDLGTGGRVRHEIAPVLRAKLAQLLDTLDGLPARAMREGPFTLLEEYLVRTNLLHDLIAVETPDSQRSLLAVARLMRFASDWQREHPRQSLVDFVEYLDLYQEIGGELDTDAAPGVEADGVQLMTVYQAKGLEYEVVVVPRLIEGQFPDTREETVLIPVELLKQRPPAEFSIAEERRLLFVAMTRARRRLLLTAIDGPAAKQGPSRFVGEVAPETDDGLTPGDVVVIRRAPTPDFDTEVVGKPTADDAAAALTPSLERLMPVPAAFERRYALRRRAVELIGALERTRDGDAATRDALVAELVVVARDAANEAGEARRNGIDPVTLRVLSRHAPAGQALLQLAPLPSAFSHSSLRTYAECPLRFALGSVYRIAVDDRKGFFEFGTTVHAAFEGFMKERRDALAAGLPAPGYELLKAKFDEAYDPRAYVDEEAAGHYARRSEPLLRRFYERELQSTSQAIAFEQFFEFELPAGDGEVPIRLRGFIDRIDRRPDGTIEVIDYKTGGAKSQAVVDADEQLSMYALALRSGALRDPVSGEALPTPSRLTLYFTEADLARSTTRSDEQLDAFEAWVTTTVRRIRDGDFSATPDFRRCGWCDYRRVCPSRWGEQ
jgi:DNA helicase-2/ATP-dependent DNA helicase PcrA